MNLDSRLDIQGLLDGLGQGVLLFDHTGRLVLDNLAARTLLGTDLNLIRSTGWTAASVLFNAGRHTPDETIDAVRQRALESARPVRFHTQRAGEYVPCWAAAVGGADGTIFTLITIESPDWSSITELMGLFRSEVKEAAEATQGHINLIEQSMKRLGPDDRIEQLTRRIGGFNRLIATHMYRTARLMDLLERLEMLRTGRLAERVRSGRTRIRLADFIEDFVEELDEIALLDPESEDQDYRGRLRVDVPSGLLIEAVPGCLTNILRDVIRNAIMYSMRAASVTIAATFTRDGGHVQIDVTDEGYGVRASDEDRVFQPFVRARQPQIIAEFGYGLSLYLCKHEVEAMNGAMWFKTEEGVGSTFSFKLPVWREPAGDSSRSSTTSA